MLPYADLRQTHSAVVFFVGDRAYKLKNPVNLGFLDFSAPQAGAAACRRETELNRRFAPDVYLGVAEVAGPLGQVGRILAAQHAASPHRPEICEQGNAGALRSRWTASYEQIRPLAGQVLRTSDLDAAQRLSCTVPMTSGGRSARTCSLAEPDSLPVEPGSARVPR